MSDEQFERICELVEHELQSPDAAAMLSARDAVQRQELARVEAERDSVQIDAMSYSEQRDIAQAQLAEAVGLLKYAMESSSFREILTLERDIADFLAQAEQQEAQGAQAGEFQREDRYIVIKRKDLEAAPFKDRINFLQELAMLEARLPKREYLVVESDWPEYEPTWAAIQARVTGQGEGAGEFWTWLDLAYRDGSKGEGRNFTKYNMEVAYRAGTEAARAALATQPAAGEPKWSCLNAWFLSLEPGRQAVLREDKWMLAGAAFDAGRQCAAPPAAPLAAGEPVAFDGKTVADRLDQMADAQLPGSSAQSDLYAAATVWRKHLAPPVAAHGDEAVRFERADVIAVLREDLLAMSGDVDPSTGRSEMECLLSSWLKGHDIPVFRRTLYAMRAQGDGGDA